MRHVVYIVFIFTAVISSCNKTPTAGFTTDRNEYTAGDTVKLNNSSRSAKTYNWTFPNGETSELESPEYIIPDNTATGRYMISLDATSEKGGKTSGASQHFLVNAGVGEITMWTLGFADTIKMSIDAAPALNQACVTNTAFPGCGATGCIYVRNQSVGTHSFSAYSRHKAWEGVFNIKRGKCLSYPLN